MRNLFGKMVITYAAKTFTTDFDGKLNTEPYQVMSKDRGLGRPQVMVLYREQGRAIPHSIHR